MYSILKKAETATPPSAEQKQLLQEEAMRLTLGRLVVPSFLVGHYEKPDQTPTDLTTVCDFRASSESTSCG